MVTPQGTVNGDNIEDYGLTTSGAQLRCVERQTDHFVVDKYEACLQTGNSFGHQQYTHRVSTYFSTRRDEKKQIDEVNA